MKEALKKKDHDLAEAQKAALDKMKLAKEKLASVGKLEEENANLKAALDAANKEVSRPTDLLSSTHRRTAGLSLNCVYRILPKL